MKTYVLVWNPAKWPFDNYKQALKDIQEQGRFVREWSCVSKKIKAGDAVLLKKTGKGLRGIVASGTAVSEPYENRHWGKIKRDSLSNILPLVLIEWLTILRMRYFKSMTKSTLALCLKHQVVYSMMSRQKF